MNADRTPRWIVAVLVVSLCLNCLFIGIGGSIGLRWRLHPQEQAMRAALRQIGRSLDRDDARVLRAAVAQHRAQIGGAWLAYHESLKPLAAALQASPQDPAQLQAAEQEARGKRIALGDAMFDAMLDGVRQISPQGRARLLRDQVTEAAAPP